MDTFFKHNILCFCSSFMPRCFPRTVYLNWVRLGPGSVFAFLCEKIIRVGHRLELKVIVARVFEKHGFLLSRLSCKSLMRLQNELHPFLFEIIGQSFPYTVCEACAEMSNWHFIAIDWVVVILSSVVIADPVTHELITKEVVVLPFS